MTFRRALRAWLQANEAALAPCRGPLRTFNDRFTALRRLQSLLWEAGWVQHGWPEAVGGLGGTAVDRAVLYDELTRHGLPIGGPFEHVEILAPPVVAHGDPDVVRAPLASLLDGSGLWCQGFSEPDAGSDLAALRTRAVESGGGFCVNGTKIWTSWAGVAKWCVLLARTGTLDERHRGLSVFLVELDTPGITVMPIRQANGTDELAEVHFEDVRLERAALVGPLGGGWQIAMDILACERTAFAWLRHLHLRERFEGLSAREEQSGETAVDLFALGCSTGAAVRRLAAGAFAGPEAAICKMALTAAEQRLFDFAMQTAGTDFLIDDRGDRARWREDYLFSRIVSVYGGTRQMQLSTLSRFVLGFGPEPVS
jgi:alkylation response protein AidB-like acyl-CoA dehydrogenase